jgi:hypothetical protein
LIHDGKNWWHCGIAMVLVFDERIGAA